MLYLFLSVKNRFSVKDEDLILVTIYRTENTDNPARFKITEKQLKE